MGSDNSPSGGSPDSNITISHNAPTTQLLLGVAGLALGQALQDRNGAFTVLAIAWVTVALICTATSVASQHLPFPRVPNKVLWIVLVTGLLWQVVQLLTTLPGIYILPAYLPIMWQYQTSVAFGGICALLSLAPREWLPLWARNGLIALAFCAVLAAGVWVIRASPSPVIDTYVFQQTSGEALLQGHNPYELTPPNIYGDLKYYGPELVKDGKMTIGNPYPPLSIYLSSLGYAIAGDIRYSHLVAILIAGVLIACLRPGREALLAAYIFLFMPRVFFVVEQSWTEPLVLLLAVVVVWCAIYRPALKYVALGLLIASKQYLLFLSPLIVLLIPPSSPRRVWVHAGSWALGAAFVVTAPLAFWNFPAFLWDVGVVQWYQVFRFDALSYLALYAHVFGQAPSQFLAFAALGAAFLFSWRYSPRSPAGFAGALALALGLFFAFNKQAFCNYYFLVIGVLCCTLAAIPTEEKLVITDQYTDK